MIGYSVTKKNKRSNKEFGIEMKGKVSIIVPVYKAEAYLSRCLDSILNQTYTNIEVILINDGSPDKSGMICDEYAQKDSRIKVIHQENKGVSSARNAGLKIAGGEYIGFVDSDDFIAPEMYEQMVQSMKSDRDLIICGCHRCNSDGMKQIKKAKALTYYELQCPEEALPSVIYQQVTMAVWSKLFRRNRILSETGEVEIFFDESLNNHEDFIFICEYICRCKGRIYLLPERLYYYCDQKGSLSNSEKSFDKILESLSAILELQQKYDIDELKSTELFYVENIWKYWVVKVMQGQEYKKPEDFKEHEKIKDEIKKYVNVYNASKYVRKYKKVIVHMLLTHERILFFATRLAGKLYK